MMEKEMENQSQHWKEDVQDLGVEPFTWAQGFDG